MPKDRGRWRQRLEEIWAQVIAGLLTAGILALIAIIGVKLATRSHTSTRVSSKTANAATEREATTHAKAIQEATALANQKATRVRIERTSNQKQLYTFIQSVMQQRVSCAPNERLPSTATAQQVCHFGSIEAVYTRLDSVRATSAFLKSRYFNSFPFSGYDGANCGEDHSRLGGPWHDGNGVPQGYWVFRTSGTNTVLLWEYRSHRVIVRASQNKRIPVNQLCEFWYKHSGETP